MPQLIIAIVVIAIIIYVVRFVALYSANILAASHLFFAKLGDDIANAIGVVDFAGAFVLWSAIGMLASYLIGSGVLSSTPPSVSHNIVSSISSFERKKCIVTAVILVILGVVYWQTNRAKGASFSSSVVNARREITVPQTSPQILGSKNKPTHHTDSTKQKAASTGDFSYTERFETADKLKNLSAGTWIFRGTHDGPNWGSVSVENGHLLIRNEVTDKGGLAAFRVRQPLDAANLTMQNYYHPANQYYFGSTHVVLVNSRGDTANISISALRSEHEPDFDSSRANFDRPRIIVSQSNQILKQFMPIRSSSVFNKWSKMAISWRAASGSLEVDFDGDHRIDFYHDFSNLIGYSFSEVRLDSYGWWTGHFRRIGEFSITGSIAKDRRVTEEIRVADKYNHQNKGNTAISKDHQYIDDAGCLREVDGSFVVGFRSDCR